MNPGWDSQGKTVAQLVEELLSFGDQTLEVRLSLDAGATSYPISLVAKAGDNYALLLNCQDQPTVIQHESKC